MQDGWLDGVRRVESPNYSERPQADGVDLLIIHGISLPLGEYGGSYIDALFCNRLDPAVHSSFAEITDLKVSAHLLIRRDGEIVQYVPLHKRAWHAGKSLFHGRQACNDFSIGIELEGCDDEPYEAAQYNALVKVTRTLMKFYPAITPQRVVGHCDVSPGRKSDPGPAFDWTYYRMLLDDESA